MKNKMKLAFAVIAIALGFATCKFSSSETPGNGTDTTGIDSAKAIATPKDTAATQPQDSSSIQ
jgi:hypothetical protein